MTEDNPMTQQPQRKLKDFIDEFNTMDANNEVIVDLMPSYGPSSRKNQQQEMGLTSSSLSGILRGSKYKQKFPMDFIISGEATITARVKGK